MVCDTSGSWYLSNWSALPGLLLFLEQVELTPNLDLGTDRSLCLECCSGGCSIVIVCFPLPRERLQSKGMPSHPNPSILSPCFVFFITHTTP